MGNITLNKTNCKFLENLQLTEITGDGTFFRKPALIQSGGQAHVDTKAEWSEPTANEHYLSFDLYIRSKSQYNISIGKKSTIKPDAPQLTTQDGTGIKNKSIERGGYRYDVEETGDGARPYDVHQPHKAQGHWVDAGYGRYCASMAEADAYIGGQTA